MIKKIVFIWIFIISFSCFSQNYLTYTPQTLSVSGKSNEEIIASIRVNCYGGDFGACSASATQYVSIPDIGLSSIGYTDSVLYAGEVANMIFKFKLTVTATKTSKYTFKAIYFDNTGGYHEKPITINVTYNFEEEDEEDGPCDLDEPSSRVTTSITEKSAIFDWSTISGNSGYEYGHKKSIHSSWTTGIVSDSYMFRRILSPGTKYEWRVRTKCSNGQYGDWSDIETFTTLSCEPTITISNTINDIIREDRSAQNTITAANSMKSESIVAYDAGETVYLKPGFHAQPGAIFKAFIEGCSSSSSKISEIIEKKVLSSVKDSLKNDDTKIFEGSEMRIFPNPTTGNFTISYNEIIRSYTLYNSYGSSLLHKETNATSLSVSIKNLPNGIYIIRVVLASGETTIKKIIKK